MDPEPICPYAPKPFPPKRLKRARFSSLLKRTYTLLEKYNALLSSHSPELLSSLSFVEAFFSLESQHLQVPFEKILLLARSHPKTKQKNAHQIFNYRQALLFPPQKCPFSKRSLCSLHRQIKQDTAPHSLLGNYRRDQNWIGPVGCSIDELTFIPLTLKKYPG